MYFIDIDNCMRTESDQQRMSADYRANFLTKENQRATIQNVSGTWRASMYCLHTFDIAFKNFNNLVVSCIVIFILTRNFPTGTYWLNSWCRYTWGYCMSKILRVLYNRGEITKFFDDFYFPTSKLQLYEYVSTLLINLRHSTLNFDNNIVFYFSWIWYII